MLRGLASGFGFPRMISLWIRRAYERRYAPSRRAFITDALLGTAAIVLTILFIAFLVRPLALPTIRVSFVAPPLEAAKAIPMLIRIRPLDGREHANASVTWHLPEAWEVLASDPPMRGDGSVFLGSIPPDGERCSRLIVRAFEAVGERTTVRYTVTDTERGKRRRYDGFEERIIEQSAVTADVPKPFHVHAVVPNGSVIPVAVTNHTERTVPFVELRPTETSTVPFPRIPLGALEPNETRYAYVSLDDLGSSPTLEWALFIASREILRDSWSAELVAWNAPDIARPLIASPGEDASVRATGGKGMTLLTVQPFAEDAIREVRIDHAAQDVRIPASSVPETPQPEWFVAPMFTNERGERLLGPATFGAYHAAFPFYAEARYRTEDGDQIGLGPHPPVAGEETRYWIFWKFGPVQGRLAPVRVRAAVPPHVRLTGNVASPYGGTSAVFGDTVRWTLPEIGSGAGLSEAYFGFEVAVLPDASDAGHAIQLLGPSRAKALQPISGEWIEVEKTALFSEFFNSERQPSAGVAQPEP